jgi:hypothetical protein
LEDSNSIALEEYDAWKDSPTMMEILGCNYSMKQVRRYASKLRRFYANFQALMNKSEVMDN